MENTGNPSTAFRPHPAMRIPLGVWLGGFIPAGATGDDLPVLGFSGPSPATRPFQGTLVCHLLRAGLAQMLPAPWHPCTHFTCWKRRVWGEAKGNKGLLETACHCWKQVPPADFVPHLSRLENSTCLLECACLPHQGKDHSWGIYPFIILETKPFTSPFCCFLNCPLQPRLSVTQEGSKP